MKRTLFFMLLSALLWGGTATVQAADYSGNCGADVTWTLDTETGVLEISGTGKMGTYGYGAVAPWYDYRKSITSVTIDDRVTTIGNCAFQNCSDLTSVTIGNSVTTIGFSAFYGCTDLTEVTIPESVISIGNYAFENCSGLTKVTIENGVQTIGSLAFYGCSNLTSITIPGSVTSIGDYAFYGCTGLTEITIPNSVTSIGYCAFYGCSNLTSIAIPGSVISIGGHAFYSCSGLTKVTIESGVQTIGNEAFRSCTDLLSITIPGSVTSIGSSAFENCIGLTSVTIEKGVQTIGFSAFSGCTGLTSVTIENGVQTIGRLTFSRCSNLTSITIPESVTSIDEAAFTHCSNLLSITIPGSVTSIGSSAFYGCTRLTAVYISDLAAWCRIAFDGYEANPLYHAHNLYLDNNPVTDLSIPAEVTEIGKCAFFGCNSLTSVTIPATVKKFGVSAFYQCSALASATIATDTIGRYAFYDCNALQKITLNEGIKEIGERAFSGCSSLLSITIPESVTSIGNNAFYGCTRLTAVYISDLAAWCRIAFDGYEANPLYCAHNLYLDNNPVTDLSIPAEVTEIGKCAFYGCNSLTSVTIPATVKKIGVGAFYQCSALASATIAADTIGNDAFERCSGLSSVTIGTGVTSIGKWAFDGCSSINAVYITDLEAWCRIAFGNWSSNPVCQSKKLYLSGRPVTDLTIPAGITEIKDFAFIEGQELKSLTIPAGVTGIGKQAFANCGMTSVKIGENIDRIGDEAFRNCASLESVTLPESITSIGTSSFAGCVGLKSVTACHQIPLPFSESSSPFTKLALEQCKLYVPTDAEELYQEAPVWKNFGQILSIDESVPDCDFAAPKRVEPADSSSLYALSKFTLVFGEKPFLVGDSAALLKADSSAYFPAGIVASTDSTLTITLTDTVVTDSGDYLLAIPAGTYGDVIYANDPTTGHCNPELTYTYTVVVVPVPDCDYFPTGVTPEDKAEVEALKTFTLEFAETPSLATEAQPITLAGNDTLLTATLAAGEGNTLAIILADTLKAAGEYTLTIPEGTFGDADFAADPTTGHCNPALTYIYTIKEPQPVKPELVKDFMPMRIAPVDSAEVTELAAFTLVFGEKPVLVGDSATLLKADSSAYFPAGIVVSSDSTLTVTLTDTVVTASGDYLLTIPEGAFGDADFADDPTTGRCTPALTYIYTIKEPMKPELVKDFMPMRIAPVDSAEVTELAEFTLLFGEKPFLVGDSATLLKADSSAYFPAGIVASTDSTLTITLTDTVVTDPGDYLLTIPEGSFGNALFAADPTTGHCNPALTYIYTIKVPQPAEPDVPENPDEPDTPDTPDVPDTPIVPDEPENPNIPDVPSEPENPDTPDTPVTPDVPENPDEPDTPDTPDVPDIPDEPENPENPDEPDDPVVPDEPDESASVTETQADAEHIAVYNLQGVLVLETDDAAALKTLQNGAYIVNGKKMIIVR